MEYLKQDLLVWWQLKRDFNLPLTIIGAIIMSSFILIASAIYSLIYISKA